MQEGQAGLDLVMKIGKTLYAHETNAVMLGMAQCQFILASGLEWVRLSLKKYVFALAGGIIARTEDSLQVMHD